LCSAASTRSSGVSTSSGSTALGSFFTALSSPVPATVPVTRPPPAVPVSSAAASSACAVAICCCIFCACCMICCRLGCPPGSTAISVSPWNWASLSARLRLADLFRAELLGQQAQRLILAGGAGGDRVVERLVARVEALVRRFLGRY